MFKIALVGRPNAGKSSLFNRFAKRREAITSEVAGTTRDVRRTIAEFAGLSAQILDTGGLEDRDETFKIVRKHAAEAAKTADLVLFMADGQFMPDDVDKKLFYELQKRAKNIALVLNKIDNKKMENAQFEFMSFGAKEMFMISCSHNRNIDDLELWIANLIKRSGSIENLVEKTDEEEKIRVAIIGRPNVGKSALLNALVGFDRSVVSSVAGTTIDPVDEEVLLGEKKVVFIDTAGIRKRGRIEGIERFAFDRTEKMLENADLALIVLDASEEFSELDERIAGLVDKHKIAAILVLNKYDIAREDYEKLEKTAREKFIFLSHAPIISLSAKSKKRVNKLADLIAKVYENYSRRIPTSQLNEIIESAARRHHLPSDRGKAVKIYYATQFGVRPPTFALIANRPKSIHFSYLRYLANQLRESADFTGSPLVLEAKAKNKTEENQ
ncbi:MAG: ribosome biogenesis GTPase Der [Helicobacteraceae bacterium]|jgi:GTP-binding protein|nr:ribosome biogenesis GTPase Der [Helicobacteraceae bacterium]